MSATLQNQADNVVLLAEARAIRRPDTLPLSLEIDLDQLHGAGTEARSPARTVWFAVLVSSALWAVIAGALWFV